jgi:hypothetical protein
MIKLVFVIFFFAVSINSQTITNYGLKLGAVESNPIWKFGTQSFNNVETRLGMDVGIFIDFSLTSKVSLLTEFHYMQKGSRFYLAEPNPDNPLPGNGYDALLYEMNLNTNYLSIPILIKYNLLNSEAVPYLLGGFRIDFLVSKNKDFESYFTRVNLNNVDFGGTIGIGFQTKSIIGIGTGIEIKYSPNFTKVVSSDYWANVTNRSFEISFIIYN